MSCNCKCNNTHRVTSVNYSGTAVALTVTNSTDIGNMEKFNLDVHKPVSEIVTGAPVPVTVTINGVANIPLKDRFARPLLSNVVPFGITAGRYITDTEGAYVILSTPRFA